MVVGAVGGAEIIANTMTSMTLHMGSRTLTQYDIGVVCRKNYLTYHGVSGKITYGERGMTSILIMFFQNV